MYMYVEGEAWQEPLQENRDYIIKKCTLYVYNNMTIKQGSECQKRGRRPTGGAALPLQCITINANQGTQNGIGLGI